MIKISNLQIASRLNSGTIHPEQAEVPRVFPAQ
jgi:hypothetical protein